MRRRCGTRSQRLYTSIEATNQSAIQQPSQRIMALANALADAELRYPAD